MSASHPNPVIIIGSGPAGLTAAIYCARASLNPIVISGLQPGGQLTTTSVIENWPGYEDGIDGSLLMKNMEAQAAKLGTKIISGTQVSKIEKSENGLFSLHFDDETSLVAKTIIVATGASALVLPLPNLDKLMGYGVSTCAVCDGFFYRNKHVVVVGGGDSAMEEALYLSKLAKKVVLIHRSGSFRASQVMQDRVRHNPQIEMILHTHVADTVSDHSGLTGVVLKKQDGSTEILKTDGLFMAIGHKPNTAFLKPLIALDNEGYVLTHQGTLTSVPGVFAAGDVEDKLYRQAVTSAGRGCQAALQAERYLQEHE